MYNDVWGCAEILPFIYRYPYPWKKHYVITFCLISTQQSLLKALSAKRKDYYQIPIINLVVLMSVCVCITLFTT